MNNNSFVSVFLQRYGLWIAVIVVILLGACFGLLIAPKEVSYELSTNPPLVVQQDESSVSEVDFQILALTNCTVAASEVELTALEKAVFDEINKYRASLGLTQLKDSVTIRNAAAWMSNDMAATKNFAHDDSTGRTFPNRMRDCGYSGASGEIIQRNPSTDARFLVQKWKDSSGHDKIMRGTNHKVMGVSNKSGYWTVDFGTKEDGGTQTPTATPTRTPTPPQNEITRTPTPSPTGTQQGNTPTPTVPDEITPTGTITTTPNGPGLLVSATLFGTSGSTSVTVQSMNGTVEVFNITGQEVLQKTITLSFNSQTDKFEGTVPLPSTFVSGNYNIKLKTENTLRESISPYIFDIRVGQQNKLPTIELVAGDLNNDNKITLQDYNLIVACTPLSTCKTMIYDLNYDGKITIEDYNVLLYAYSNIFGE